MVYSHFIFLCLQFRERGSTSTRLGFRIDAVRVGIV